MADQTTREAALAQAIKNLGSSCATPEHGVFANEIHRGDCSQCASEILTAWGQRERDEALRERNLEWIEWLEQQDG